MSSCSRHDSENYDSFFPQQYCGVVDVTPSGAHHSTSKRKRQSETTRFSMAAHCFVCRNQRTHLRHTVYSQTKGVSVQCVICKSKREPDGQATINEDAEGSDGTAVETLSSE